MQPIVRQSNIVQGTQAKIDLVPTEIKMMFLKCLNAQERAATETLNKSWKAIASSNSVWNPHYRSIKEAFIKYLKEDARAISGTDLKTRLTAPNGDEKEKYVQILTYLRSNNHFRNFIAFVLSQGTFHQGVAAVKHLIKDGVLDSKAIKVDALLQASTVYRSNLEIFECILNKLKNTNGYSGVLYEVAINNFMKHTTDIPCLKMLCKEGFRPNETFLVLTANHGDKASLEVLVTYCDEAVRKRALEKLGNHFLASTIQSAK